MKWACFKIAFDQKMTEDMDTFGSWCPCSESLAQCHQRVVPYWFVKSYLLSHYFPCPCTRNVWTLSMTGSWCLFYLSSLPKRATFFLFSCRNYMNDSLRTDVFVRYSPETIACACIYLSARKLGIVLPKKPAWYLLFGCVENDLKDISIRILKLYTRSKVWACLCPAVVARQFHVYKSINIFSFFLVVFRVLAAGRWRTGQDCGAVGTSLSGKSPKAETSWPGGRSFGSCFGRDSHAHQKWESFDFQSGCGCRCCNSTTRNKQRYLCRLCWKHAIQF